MGNALLVDFINMYLQVANSVDVVCIPGNHDNLYMYMAGEYLDAWFRDVKEVQVFNQPTLRKYYK